MWQEVNTLVMEFAITSSLQQLIGAKKEIDVIVTKRTQSNYFIEVFISSEDISYINEPHFYKEVDSLIIERLNSVVDTVNYYGEVTFTTYSNNELLVRALKINKN